MTARRVRSSVVSTLTLDDFRALARSSPWLWRTLRFSVEFERPAPRGPQRLRARVSRPRGLRVEDQDGRLIQAGWYPPADQGMKELTGDPVFRPDGLVARRPDDWQGPCRYDDPMFHDYRWVAMLHAFELADGVERDDDGSRSGSWAPERPPIDVVGSPREVDHFGRSAWEAQVVTTPSYSARCSCCPLLAGDEAARRLAAEGWSRTWPGRPSSWRVRLDRGTGVIVQLTEMGGHSPGGGFTMRIEAVDEPMPRELFGSDVGGGRSSATAVGTRS